MGDDLKQLNPDEALTVLKGYVQRNLGPDAQIKHVSYRDDFKVWEGWVSGVEGYVKAYIVRLAPANGEWVCRHVTVMDSPPGARG